jgi:hypothetical protein
MNETGEQELIERDIASYVFGNSPTLLALCLTVIGLIKIYAVSSASQRWPIICCSFRLLPFSWAQSFPIWP